MHHPSNVQEHRMKYAQKLNEAFFQKIYNQNHPKHVVHFQILLITIRHQMKDKFLIKN